MAKKKNILIEIAKFLFGVILGIFGLTTTAYGVGAILGVPMFMLGVYIVADVLGVTFKL